MNLLIPILAVLAVLASGPLGLLLYVAILCIVLWAIYALLQWAGITIPPPVRIVFIALVCVAIIVVLFRLFEGVL